MHVRPRGRAGERRPQDHRADVLRRGRLEEVGTAARAVADVVADQIRDHRRVPRIVLGNPGFDLSDQVGPHVGGLRVDATAELREQGNQARAEAVADDQERDLLRLYAEAAQDEEEPADAEEAHRHHEEPGHRPAAQRELEGPVEARPHRGRGPQIGPDRDEHADVAGDARAERAEHEGERGRHRHVHGRRRIVRGRRAHRRVKDENQRRHAETDQEDGPVLAAQERFGAFLDGRGDALHLGRSLVRREHLPRQVPREGERQHADQDHEQDHALTSTGRKSRCTYRASRGRCKRRRSDPGVPPARPPGRGRASPPRPDCRTGRHPPPTLVLEHPEGGTEHRACRGDADLTPEHRQLVERPGHDVRRSARGRTEVASAVRDGDLAHPEAVAEGFAEELGREEGATRLERDRSQDLAVHELEGAVDVPDPHAEQQADERVP